MSRKQTKLDFGSGSMKMILGIQKRRKEQGKEDVRREQEAPKKPQKRPLSPDVSPQQPKSISTGWSPGRKRNVKRIVEFEGEPERKRINELEVLRKGRGFKQESDATGFDLEDPTDSDMVGSVEKVLESKVIRKGRGFQAKYQTSPDIDEADSEEENLFGNVEQLTINTKPQLSIADDVKRRRLERFVEPNQSSTKLPTLINKNKRKKLKPKPAASRLAEALQPKRRRKRPPKPPSNDEDIEQQLQKISEKVDNAKTWEKAPEDADITSLSFTKKRKPDQVLYRPKHKISQNLDDGWGGNVLNEAMTYAEARGICLLLEDEIQHFVRTHNKDSILIFPKMNSYHRMLLHKITARFNLKSFSDGLYDDRRARIKYTEKSAVPLISLRDWVIRDERTKCEAQLRKYKALSRRRPGDKITNVEMEAEDCDLTIYDKPVRPIYKWELISAEEEGYWMKHKAEVMSDIADNKVGVEHIVEVTFSASKTEDEMQQICENLCEVIDSQCEICIIDDTTSVVILDSKKFVMAAMKEGPGVGCRVCPFIDASNRVKSLCGFPVKTKRAKKNMTVAHRMLGHALGVKNFGENKLKDKNQR